VLLAVLLLGGSARADDDVDTYRAVVALGSEKFNAGDFTGARAEFQKAYAIHPAPVLLFNIASCHRRAGEHDQALAAYERFIAAAPADDGRLPLARETVEHLKALLAERAAVEAERKAAEEARRPPPPPPEPEPDEEVVEEDPPPVALKQAPPPDVVATPAPRGVLPRRVGIGMMAGGVVAIGLSLWQVQVAATAESDLETLPAGAAWNDEQAELYERGQSAQNRALVLGIGGVALAAGGAALYLVGRHMNERPRQVSVGATVAGDRAALVLSGRF
jgi:tetratricopeptide (TPR) repeat protein